MKTDQQISNIKTVGAMLSFIQRIAICLWLIIPMAWFYLCFFKYPDIADLIIKEDDSGALSFSLVIAPFLLVYLIMQSIKSGVWNYNQWVRNEEIASIPKSRYLRWFARDDSNPDFLKLVFKNNTGKMAYGYFKAKDIPDNYGKLNFKNRNRQFKDSIQIITTNLSFPVSLLPNQFDRSQIQTNEYLGSVDGRFLMEPDDEIELTLYKIKQQA